MHQFKPSLLDIIIPGRYLLRRDVHTEETLKKLGSGRLRWNTVTKVWLAWYPFWLVVFVVAGASKDFLMLTGAAFTPYAIYAYIFVPFLVILYPGMYYLFHKQSLTMRYASRHVLTTGNTETVKDCRLTLALWRSFFLPGMDTGKMSKPLIGKALGWLQQLSFMTPLWLASLSVTLGMMMQGRYFGEEWLTSTVRWFASDGNYYGLLAHWAVSLIAWYANYCCSYAWLGKVIELPETERASLPL